MNNTWFAIILIYFLVLLVIIPILNDIYRSIDSDRKYWSSLFFWPVWGLMWFGIGLYQLGLGAKEVFCSIVGKKK
jgi:di/tricarboxylate transporter